MFPKAIKIDIGLVYPQQDGYRRMGTLVADSSTGYGDTVRSAEDPSEDTRDSVPRLSLAIHRGAGSRCTQQELYTRRIVKQFIIDYAPLDRSRPIRLEAYHLGFAISETWATRKAPGFWEDLTVRLGKACPVAAKVVNICFGVQICGETSKLLVSCNDQIEVNGARRGMKC